ncbi:hypothetical protein [Nocardia asiatica]|uniref:hypothetical protein n=1 Tax=Nocardia asiatica TaxID=209252 RepID=UPI002454D244|nr:hypothetical protein [Nocardia asiatica]
MTANMGGHYSRSAAIGETNYVHAADVTYDDEVQYDVEAGLAQLRRRLGFDRIRRPISDSQTQERHEDHYLGWELFPPAAWQLAERLHEVGTRMDALLIAPLRIRSTTSPEVAVRLGNGKHGERWSVSWLPDMILSRQQALSAMVFDEILTDPQELDSAAIMRILRYLADELRMPLEHVLVRLSSVKTDCRRPTRSRLRPLWDTETAMAREA